jgi:dihydroorotate dehydrogenase electron transfer subunit
MGLKKIHSPIYLKAEIAENKEIGSLYHHMRVSLPLPIGPIVPGQFAMLSIEGNKDILLPRPFSIHNFDKAEDASQLDFLYKVVGKGTELLGKLPAGYPISILAPLGKGFPDAPSGYKTLLVAGGMGVVPLFPLLLRLRKSHTSLHFLYGAKSEQDLICLPALIKLKGITMTIATEDGTSGEKGVVTKLLEHEEDEAGAKMAMYACGPEPMLKVVADFAAERNMPCWISLERRMACGVGACLSCIVMTKEGYKCSCTEGPTFASRDILWRNDAEPQG